MIPSIGSVLFLCTILIARNQVVDGSRSTVTNEDIRDAILQVVNVVRTTEDKLERHEYRERSLGDLLKKGMISIDKRIKLLDPLKGTVGRLDERLAAVETILMQKDERERVQNQKTYETVEDIRRNLPIIVEKLKSDIIEKLSLIKIPEHGEISKKDFDRLRDNLTEKIDKIANSIGSIGQDLNKMKEENKNIREMNIKSSENLDKVKRQLDTSEQLLEKYENKLAEYNNRIPEAPPANYKDQMDWHTNFMQALEVQKSHVEQILSDVKSISSKVNKLPNKADLENAHNTTLDSLQEIKYETEQQPAKSAKILDARIKDVRDDIDKKHEEAMKNIDKISEMAESLSEDFLSGHERIRNEIQNLAKVDQVMIQTADSVLDTKRRVEYGVHQILTEVANQVKASSKDINKAISERFDIFEMSILDEDSGALANLTSKIGQEIDQVWRQIGIMHQQMSASTDTLNKLQNQTDAYVNGSLNVMDTMKGKVGKITGRITEIDENLNFLVGKLSLVAQEFNHIKSGLGKTLDEMRATFKTVDKKIKDNGPGPHDIPSNEIEDDVPTKK